MTADSPLLRVARLFYDLGRGDGYVEGYAAARGPAPGSGAPERPRLAKVLHFRSAAGAHGEAPRV